MPEIEANGVRFRMSLGFANDSITLSNVCTFPDGGTVPATVTAPIENTITVVEARSGETKLGSNGNCNARLDAGSMKYSVSGSTMTIKDAREPTSLTLNREAGTTGNGLIGTWTLPTVNQNGIRLTMSLTFTDGSVILKNTCEAPTGSATVSVEARTKTSFTILAAKSTENNDNPTRTCDASIDQGTVDYLVNGSKLTLSMPNQPQPLELTRK